MSIFETAQMNLGFGSQLAQQGFSGGLGVDEVLFRQPRPAELGNTVADLIQLTS